MIKVIYIVARDIILGNAAGHTTYRKGERYSAGQLEKSPLTQRQINAIFIKQTYNSDTN